MVDANSIMMHGFDNSGQSSSATPTAWNMATLRHQTLSRSTSSNSITTRTYSAASSRTNDTDYGIHYTHRALFQVPYDSDYRQDRNHNSDSYTSAARRVAYSYFTEHDERILMDDVIEEEVHEPLPSLTPEYLKSHFLQEGRLTHDQALDIINTATNTFSREPNLVHIQMGVLNIRDSWFPSVTHGTHSISVCGDIRGQYVRPVYMISLCTSLNFKFSQLHLVRLFEQGNSFQDNLYLFLGDYADRGAQGIEVRPCMSLYRAVPLNPYKCLLYLYALKIHSPDRIVLLRGCQECRHPSKSFTFKSECLQKYTETVYEAFLRSFYSLPISALIDESLFCVHGGISPGLNTLNDINHACFSTSYALINRFVEIGSYGLLCDLLCSDPLPNFDKETGPTTSSLDLTSTFAERRSSLAVWAVVGPQAVTRMGCAFIFVVCYIDKTDYSYEGVRQFLDLNDLLFIITGHGARSAAGYKKYRKTEKHNKHSVISISSMSNYQNMPHIPGIFLIYAKEEISIRPFGSYPAVNGTRRLLDTRRGVIQSKIRAIGRFMLLLQTIRCAYYLFVSRARSD
ncbi:LOW QUALITY PROTEIN: hypothetical protein CVT25_002863 [Psilocybe cyanescens]|uniref:Serine/threonine specific protein phosphatases domain-containing protein n=1 Tax=Psilocybe cyanescens TaxID=93625 RepID=A0A409X4Y3_PSICY|nr:LOW QUALITY PROTEIN: hypothetical protein CVT25_002863 [Psilocybe cyanescens]